MTTKKTWVRKNKLLKEASDEDDKKEPPAQTIEVPMPSDTTQPQNISLDQNVDRYLVQYERESIPGSQQFPMTESIGVNDFLSYLFEADDDPMAELGDADDGGGDMGDLGGDTEGGPDMGGDPAAGAAPAEPAGPAAPQPILNIKTFAMRLARLINNFDVLVNPKITIMNRANAYVAKNYGDNTAKELMITLDTSYGLSPRGEQQKDVPPAPYGIGATVGDADSGVPTGGGGGDV